MAIVNTYQGDLPVSTGNVTHPLPRTLSLQIPVTNTSGNWLLLVAATASQTQVGTPATVSVSDDAHNWWEPVFAPQSTSSSAGNVRVSAWMAPAAAAASNVMIAPTANISAVCATIYEISGQSVWVSTGAINEFANSATTMPAMAIGAPPSSSFFVTAAVHDGLATSLTVAGAGWSSTTITTAPNQLRLVSATQTSSAATSATWTAGATKNLAAVTFFVVVSATPLVARSPFWPVTIAEMAFGSGFLTPPDQMVWQPVTSSYLELSVTQGRQYETAQLSAGEGALYLDNPAGQFLPGSGQDWQVQFVPNGVTATPGIASTAFAVTGGLTYEFTAAINLSANYASGVLVQIDWRTSGNVHISNSTGNSLTVAGAGVSTVIAAAPSNAASCFANIICNGTPPSSLTVQAAGNAGSTIIFPSSSTIWAGFNGVTFTSLLPWNAYGDVTTGTPVRLRTVWDGGSWEVNFHGNGSTANPAVNGNTFFLSGGFANPGQSFAQSAWIGLSAAWASGVQIQISFFTGGLGLISTFTSAGSATTVGPTFLTVSGVAPATTVFVNFTIIANGTPAASLIISAQCGPLVPGGRQLTTVPSPWGTANASTIVSQSAWTPDPSGPVDVAPWAIPFSGYVERLPQQWDENLRGFVQAGVTDYWFACNFQPQPILIQEILNDEPYAYWTLGDGPGATTAANIAASAPFPGTVSNLPLVVTPSKYSTTGFTEAFGNSSPTTLLGAQNTLVVSNTFKLTNNASMWEQDIPNPTANQLDGFCLTCSDSNYPAVTGGVSIELWFQAQPPNSPGYAPVLLEIGSPANGLSADYWSISLNAGGVPNGALTIGGTYATTSFFSSVNYYSNPPLTHLVITFNQTNYTTYVNGVVTGAATAWAFGATLPQFNTINVGGGPLFYIPGTGFVMSAFGGFIGHVAVFAGQLTAQQIWTHYQAGAFAMAGEPDYFRIERLLTGGNALGRRAILQDQAPELTPVVSMQDTASQPTSQSISNITSDLLPGMFYVAPTGDLFYLDKSYAYDQPVKWAIGDAPYNGEVTYEGDISYEFDPTRVINQIQLTQLDDETITTTSLTAIEAASQAQYGTISDLATGYLQNDASFPYNAGPGLFDLANWLAANYQAPLLRLTAVTINAASYPPNWPAVLGMSVGDIVTVARRPPGGQGEFIFMTGRITQTQRSFQFSTRGVQGSVKLMIDAAPEENALTLDDAVRGLLNGTNILGW